MDKAPISHVWAPIEDLPENWRAIARPDLDATLRQWQLERASLRDQSRVEKLADRLATLWAIETGVIERLYTIDRGTTESLVELGLEAVQQFSTTGRLTRQAMLLIEDQRATIDFLFAHLKDERPLSTSYAKELHQLLLRNQDHSEAVAAGGQRFQTTLVKRDWKKLSNNPLTPDGSIHEYCPPEFVQEEMENLLRMHHEHEASSVRPEVEAAWLHHRFSQIHPFQDGNGRVARALSTMVFLKHGFLPLVIRDVEHRDKYIDALERADKGDLSGLVVLFADIEALDMEDAITYVRELRGGGIHEIARSAAEALKRRVYEYEERSRQQTDGLVTIVRSRFEEVAAELRQVFDEAGLALEANVYPSDEGNKGWWQSQIFAGARRYGYFVDTSRYRRWVQLRLTTPEINAPRWRIVVSFHHKESRAGLMAASAFLTTSETGGEDERPVELGSDHEFTYSGARTLDEDFRGWLEAALKRLLEDWQARV